MTVHVLKGYDAEKKFINLKKIIKMWIPNLNLSFLMFSHSWREFCGTHFSMVDFVFTAIIFLRQVFHISFKNKNYILSFQDYFFFLVLSNNNAQGIVIHWLWSGDIDQIYFFTVGLWRNLVHVFIKEIYLLHKL